jgi:GGDEF domain-containing protein
VPGNRSFNRGSHPSIGTACARLDDTTPGDRESFLKALITDSDAAMYRAKRLGGNQFHHHELCR